MSLRFITLLLASSLATGHLAAQNASSSITGSVRDSSGGVMPRVTVSATKQGTNQTFRAETSSEGLYNLPNLPVGTFNVTVVAAGFQKTTKTNLLLQVDERVRVDFELAPGSTAETITVEAAAPLVDTTQSSLRSVVDSARMTELPLNGRNMLELQLLTPGVIGNAGAGGGVQSANTGFSVNGGRGATVNYALDGGDNNDHFGNTAAFYPIPDAVQEFSIQSNAFSAEYGNSTGAIVNVVTRSGTNDLHGSLFEFFRHDALNTGNFFSINKPKLRQNQFGGTLGGPVLIPKLYDGHNRTFFFASYQGTRVRSAPTRSNVFVPTELERAGDWSASARKPNDPLTGQPFPNDRIPANRLDPVAQRFLNQYVPLPNLPGGQLSSNLNDSTDSDQGLLRIDHSLSDMHKLFWRNFTQVQITEDGDQLPFFRNKLEFRSWNMTLGDSLIITPSLVNSFNATMNRTASFPGPTVNFRWRDLGAAVPLTGPESDPTNSRVIVNNAFQFSQRIAQQLPRTVIHLSDSLSYTRGKHFLKVGGEFRHLQEIRRSNQFVDGTFTFNGQFTGLPVADFLIGRPLQFQQQGGTVEGLARNVRIGIFAQDDWKIHRNLTLNVGLRWEPWFPIVDQRDRRTAFRAGVQSTQFPSAPTGYLFPGDPGIGRGIVPNRYNNFAPRFGFAWDPRGNGRTAIRGGYGIFYDMPALQNNIGFMQQPFAFTYTVNAPASTLNPYGSIAPVIPYLPPQTPEERARFRFVTPTQMQTIPEGFRNAYVQQWNFTLDRELFRQTRVSASYVGTKGTNLYNIREANAAVFRPGATVANTDQRRPFGPVFQSIQEFASGGNSSYNALQVTLNRRLANGFTVLTSYTWGKSIDQLSVSNPNLASADQQNPNDLRSERAVSDYDITHNFVGSFVWNLPSLQASPRLLRHVLGRWQWSGITQLQSGRPFDVSSGRDNSLTGVNRDRPNVVGDWRLSGDRSRQQQIDEYFNRSAFAQNATGTFGNAGRNLLRGPGQINFDTALVKSIPLWERSDLQFRAEAFNVFNNVNLGNPVGNLAAGNYGRITAAGPSRVLQAALKLNF